MGRTRVSLAVLGLAVLAACSGEPDLIRLQQQGDGPDEFGILPNRPLEAPENFAALPAPTPGAGNRADLRPLDDAVIALGGRPGGSGGGVQGGALVNHTTRYGVDGAIREQLAAEDRAYRQRRRGRVLERVFGTTTYFDAYEDQSLDQDAVLQRGRALGHRTPAAPPPESGD
ncbi:DUF3035 domain-containing protein [Palleronia caenipelagi]|uniref:DUF3035 domain-containing protein n=1 Tax=Palleronia caenipelagi TaxID=2489174 RepID=A0A547Q7B9_9RHOB|nr:DUF3035 domain-containing protein [Palleronia caenipelagi]TRD22253.1 DUF3035 domain-containing protein [Palleronia caenipelagi]